MSMRYREIALATLSPVLVNAETGEVSGLPYVRPWHYNGGDLLTETVIEGESMTDQSQSDSVDINKIMRNVERTGVMPIVDDFGTYADVTGLQGDFTEMVNDSRSVQGVVKEALDAKAKAEAEEAEADREAGRAARKSGKTIAGSQETPPNT